MSACERCWGDAYMRYLASGDGRSQYDHYLELLAERADSPCTPAERAGAQASWLCPNEPRCPHVAALHDIDEMDDPSPTCCVDGCTCGHSDHSGVAAPTDPGAEETR